VLRPPYSPILARSRHINTPSFIIKDGKDPVDLRLPTRKAWDQADSFCVKRGLVSSTYGDSATGSDYIFRCIHAGTQTGRTPFGDALVGATPAPGRGTPKSILAVPSIAQTRDLLPAVLPNSDVPNVAATIKSAVSGCWVLDTEFGLLQPTNLSPEFEVEGLEVVVTMRKRDGLTTACMVGALVTISQISRAGAVAK